MLQSLNDLFGFRLHARDGEPVGVATDLLFDERVSIARYLLIEPEWWLPGGALLIAPEALEPPDAAGRRLATRLSRAALEESPQPEAPDAPRWHEEVRLHEHFRWRPYWSGGLTRGLVPYWGAAGGTADDDAEAVDGANPLRSARHVEGFEIAASDGHVGRIEDLIVDLASWTLRYLVVDTSSWLPGRRVLVSPQWLSTIDWVRRTVALDLPVERIETSPPYDRSAALDRRFEAMLHEHVARPGYW